MTARSRTRGARDPGAHLRQVVIAALDDMKAVNVKELDVRGLTDIVDTMIVASGTSDRHLRAIADRVMQQAKAAGARPRLEGQNSGEWLLVDLPDLLVHVMLPRTRELYALEQLWEPLAAGAGRAAPARRASSRAAPRSSPRARKPRKRRDR